tara:strand:+ start:106 stop:957 length:852 start_codon:yes stop_codon:yes gene_type:complete
MMDIKKIFSDLLSLMGLFRLSYRMISKNGQFVLMFHGVSTIKRKEILNNAQPHIDKNDLEKILQWLTKHFDFLTPNDLINTDKSGVLLTFDDGFANNYNNVLPLIEKYKCHAIYFITTQHLMDPKDWLSFTKENVANNWSKKDKIPEELQRDLYDGMSESMLSEISLHPFITIGNHSETHPLLSRCSDDQLIREIKDSKLYLEQLISKKVEYFAYPTGDYNQKVIDFVRDIGYKAAFGIDNINNIGFPKFEIPRVGIYSSKKSYLEAKMSGLYHKPLNRLAID